MWVLSLSVSEYGYIVVLGVLFRFFRGVKIDKGNKTADRNGIFQ